MTTRHLAPAHRGPSLLAAAFLLVTAAPSQAAPDAGLPPDIEAEIRAATTGDLASAMRAAVDSSPVFLSAKAFRAIRAIEAYRRGAQRKELTAAERVFDNFDIAVNAPDKSRWLTKEQKKTCYEIVLWPRPTPGERVATDTPAKLGRSAVYAVRKSDFRVVRAELDSQRRW